VRSAEAQLHSASAQIGVAMQPAAAVYLDRQCRRRSQPNRAIVYDTGNRVLERAGNVAQTIFDAGTLLHRRRAAQAAFDQAAALYRSTVIISFQNVADALRALQADADALKAAVAAEHAAARASKSRRRQLQLGAIHYLALLTVEMTYQQALIKPGSGAGQSLYRHRRPVSGRSGELVEPKGFAFVTEKTSDEPGATPAAGKWY